MVEPISHRNSYNGNPTGFLSLLRGVEDAEQPSHRERTPSSLPQSWESGLQLFLLTNGRGLRGGVQFPRSPVTTNHLHCSVIWWQARRGIILHQGNIIHSVPLPHPDCTFLILGKARGT